MNLANVKNAARFESYEGASRVDTFLANCSTADHVSICVKVSSVESLSIVFHFFFYILHYMNFFTFCITWNEPSHISQVLFSYFNWLIDFSLLRCCRRCSYVQLLIFLFFFPLSGVVYLTCRLLSSMFNESHFASFDWFECLTNEVEKLPPFFVIFCFISIINSAQVAWLWHLLVI